MKLYHLTTDNNAISIVKNGFKDHTGSYGIFDGKTKRPKRLKGVFFTDCIEAISGYLFKPKGTKTTECDSVFIVKIPIKNISNFELVEKDKTYREWCIPASTVNKYFINRKIHSIDDKNLYDKPKAKILFNKLGMMTREEIIKTLF